MNEEQMLSVAVQLRLQELEKKVEIRVMNILNILGSRRS
jgi:hypothetical protein